MTGYSKITTKAAAATLFICLATQVSVAADVGMIESSFAAHYQQGSPGCSTLLVTGQFLAPTPGYKVTVTQNEEQNHNPMLVELTLSATPPDSAAPQVLTLTPVVYFDPKFNECPYGVSITYEKQQIVIGLMPAVVPAR